ncbi:MAG: NifU-like protein [Syntrophus sp. PtaB.Bin001]|jgi:NifU-like protein involved in Fe-S cluster formation|nr:MAG: NifU-like protein [Syntrophus sp. PtaB.Bin001]
MTPLALLTTALVMTVAALVWFGIHFYLNSFMENPDGIAKVTGSCGDTMEIALKFNGSKVEDTHSWTDGCAISKMCLETAVMLARGKTLPELRKIDTAAILEKVGNLPDTHIHCAILAETTLQKALDVYVLKLSETNAGETDRLEKSLQSDGLHDQTAAVSAENPKYVVYLFPSFNYVAKAEKILKERGIAYKLIPVPRHISSDCGVCLRIMEGQREITSETLQGKVSWENIVAL